jgi:tetratricopeptide (TPR) repeat protein/HEAT repeat protein
MIHFFGGNSPERRVARLLAKGERLFQHGRQREGIEKFAEAANVLPEASKPSLHLGRAYCKLEEYDLALKHYYKALYFCEITEEPGILCEIAQIYLKMRRYDIAEEKLKKVLYLDLPFPPSLINEMKKTALNGLAHIYLRTGRISDAIEQQKILLKQFPESIHVIQMLAESHRRLGENHEAGVLLRKAVELAKYSGRHPEVEQLERKLRAVGFPDGTEFGIKEQLYADYGSICLGTASDNGIQLEARYTLNPLSSEELAVTLRRLAAFIRAFSWTITCIGSVDKHSALLSSVMASFLNVPMKAMSKVTDHDHVLLGQILFKTSKQTKKMLKKLRKRTDSVITFALFALVNDQDQEYMPDIIGIPVQKDANGSRRNSGHIFPRSSQETPFFEISEAISPDTFFQHLSDMLYDLPEEENVAQQIAYYRVQNIQIRPHLVAALDLQKSFSEPVKETTHQEMINQLCSKRREEMFAGLTSIRNKDLQHPSILATLKTLYIESCDAGIRRMVGQHLLHKAYDDGLTYLIDLFHNPDTDVLLKMSIVDTLGLSSSRKISGVVSSALRDRREDLRIHAVRYLNKLDLSMRLSDLFEQLLGDIPVIIVKTIRYLTTCKVTPMYAVLREFLPNLLHHEDPVVVHEALNAIHVCEERAVTPVVIELLTHHDQHIVEHAIVTLGVIGNIDSGYHLLPFLEHENPNFRYAAAESLTKLDQRRSLVFLMERLRKESPDVQVKLLKLLGEVGSYETVPFIVRFAEQHLEELQIVSAAMSTLAQLPDSRSLSFVRKAAAKFPDDEIISYYISIAGTVGEEKDFETLLPYLDYPPAIQFRVAALLYKRGMKRYFHILQDGIRSTKIPVNLLAIEILGEIGDELSTQVMFSVFERQHPQLDRKITEVIFRHSKSLDYYVLFRMVQPSESEIVMQGIHRAIHCSRSVSEVMMGLESLYALLQSEATPVIQQLCSTVTNSVVVRGAMTCLSLYDPTGSQDLIKKRLDDEDVETANTAYLIMSKLKVCSFSEK